MSLTKNSPAPDFNAVTSERTFFTLSRLKGSKIILSFYREGACTISNARLDILKKYGNEFREKNVQVVSIFESMPRDIISYAGKSEPPFFVLADPMSLLHDLYEVKSSEKKSNKTSHLPADFLIDENFTIKELYYADKVTDFLPAKDLVKWVRSTHPDAPKPKKYLHIPESHMYLS